MFQSLLVCTCEIRLMEGLWKCFESREFGRYVLRFQPSAFITRS